MVKNSSKFGIVAVTSGILLMALSLVLYYFVVNDFLREVHSEIFGVGGGIFVIGVIFIIFRVKLG